MLSRAEQVAWALDLATATGTSADMQCTWLSRAEHGGMLIMCRAFSARVSSMQDGLLEAG